MARKVVDRGTPAPGALRGVARKFIFGTGPALLVKASAFAAALVLQVVVARFLEAEGYGDWRSLLAWVNIAVMVAKLGQDGVAVRFLSSYHAAGNARLCSELRSFSMRVVATGVVAFGGLLVLVGHRFALDERILGASLIAALAFSRLIAAQLRSVGQVARALAAQELLVPSVTLMGVLLVGVAMGPMPMASVIGAAIVGNAVAILWAMSALRRSLNRVASTARPSDRAGWPDRLRHRWLFTGVPLMAAGGLHLLMTRVDLLMVDHLRGAADAGVYGALTRVGMLVGFVALAVNAKFVPMISTLHERGDREQLVRLLTYATWMTTGAGVLVGLTIALFSGHVLAVFGTEFVIGRDALVVFALGQIVVVGMALTGPLLNMTGHERIVAYSLAVAVVVNVVLNSWTIPRHGLVGAAAATIATKIAWHAFITGIVSRRLGIYWIDVVTGRALTGTRP